MRHLFPVLIAVFSIHTVSAATIYMWTDEKGNTVYSDQPHPNATEIEVQEPQTYTPSSLPVSPPDQPANKKPGTTADTRYSELKIAKPVNDNPLRSNNGQVDVELSISPGLDIEHGDYITLYLDDEVVVPSTTSTRITLDNIDRGTHRLRAEIRDRDHSVLRVSETTTFHLLRYSALFKKPPVPGSN